MSGYSISQLFEKSSSDKIVLPNFQRQFVWDRGQQKRLLASVMTNIPSGSLLLLKGKGDSFTSRKIGEKKNIPKTKKLGDEILFLLDGQQRLTCLHSFFVDFFETSASSRLQTTFSKLHTRWFYEFKASEENFLGFQNLVFSEERFESATPSDVLDGIVARKDINKKKKPAFYDVRHKLESKTKECADENLLPLQLLSNHLSEFKKILRSIAKLRMDELIHELSEAEMIKILMHTDPTVKDTYAKRKKATTKKKKEELDLELLRVQMNHHVEWASEVSNYFEGLLDQNIPVIELDTKHVSKASVIFEYLNKGGTKLSTFDLFSAKFYTLDIRAKLKTELENNLLVPNSISSKLTDWSPEWVKITDIKTGIWSSAFEDQFLNTLSLLIHLNESGIGNITVDNIKRDSILELEQKTIEPYVDDAIKGLLRTYCFLQLKCGLIRTTDISYELQILPLAVVLSDDANWKKMQTTKLNKVYAKLEYYYWLSLFSGRFSKDQNARSIQDVKLIHNWVYARGDVDDKIGLSSDQFKWILNLPDFVDEQILLNDNKEAKTPKSIVQTIHAFILSNEPADLDLENKGYGNLIAYQIGKDEYSVEDHHFIPISQGKKKLNQSSKEIRNDKDHKLNSILNRVYIRKESNRYIRNLETKKYVEELVKTHGRTILVDYFITYNNKNFNDNKTSHNSFVKSRYNSLIDGIIRHLKKLYGQI